MEVLKKAIKIISKEYLNRAIVLFFLMIICVVLETLGVALVFPALTFLAEGNFYTKFETVNEISNFLSSNFEKKDLILFGIGSVLFIYFIKNIFLFIFTWWQKSFADKLYRNICERLLRNYMFLSYASYLNKNSALLARNFVEVKGFLKYIDYFILLIIEIFVLIGISTLLLLVEPFGTIIVATIITLIALLFNRITRKYIKLWGEKRLYQSGLSFKSLLQAINSFKIIKVLGREENFISQYINHNFKYSVVKKYFDILDNSPRFWLEFLGVFGLCFLTFILIKRNYEIATIVPTLGLFSVAAYRLLPSVIRILRSLQALNFSKPVVNTLAQELGDSKEKKYQPKNFENIFKDKIEIKNLYFKYPKKNNYVLKDLSFEIKKGETIGIMGTTGSGKSTFVDIFIGLLVPEKGKISIDNVSIEKNIRSWQNLIGYAPQSVHMIDDTIKNNIIFGISGNEADNEKINEIIKITQLEEFIKNLPEGLDTIVGEKGIKLSGGQQQRIGISRALYNKPSIIIFDEATSALDSETEKKLMKEIERYSKDRTLLIVSHRKTTLEYCNQIYKLEDSQLHKDLS